MNEIEPRQQLRAAVETLSEERAQTLLGWLRMMRRERDGPFDDQLPQPRGDSVGRWATWACGGRRRPAGRACVSTDLEQRTVCTAGSSHLIDYSMGGAVVRARGPALRSDRVR
jgi:hypothetical protein